MKEMTELNVNGLGAASKDNGVDLDGLTLITRPQGIDEWAGDKRMQWLNDNGYDLSVDLDDATPWLHAVATNLTAIHNSRWEDDDLSWIESTLLPGSLASPLVLWQLQEPDLPVTFAFRTLNGVSGLFRMTAYSTPDKKATIQIKLA